MGAGGGGGWVGRGGGGGLNDFRFISRFPSDGAACVAVKGLTFDSEIGLSAFDNYLIR